MANSIGQIIRDLYKSKISPVYSLFGGDSFLEDYFINQLSDLFLTSKGEKKFFSLDQDLEEEFFRELSAISMFEENRVIIVREIKKIRSNQGREDLLQYIKSPNLKIVLLIISDEYDLKNSLLKNITKYSVLVDTRTPFENKMKEWVRFILKSKNIKITEDAVDYFIRNYGDSISHTINEIDKTSLLLGNVIISENNIEKLDGYKRIYKLWHLQDSIGKKRLNQSLEIITSLIQNGIKIPQILVNLVNLYKQILWKKMGQNNNKGFSGINKIITSNISYYDKLYSHNEIKKVLAELRKIDLLCKTTSINDLALIQPLLIKICKSQYV